MPVKLMQESREQSELPPETSPPSSGQAMIDQLRTGDERAWHEFLSSYHEIFVRSVRCALHRVTGRGMAVAEELAATVDDAKTYFYGAFMANFATYSTESRFCAYLFRTVTHFVQERGRRRRKEVPLNDDSQWGPIARDMAEPGDDDRHDSLRRCIGRLADAFRSVLLLLYYSERPMTMAVIAEVLGTSAAAVHKRHQRGMLALRECMERSGDSA